MSSKSVASTVWLKRFMVFLLVIIVALCFGLTIFYFMRDNENLFLNKNIESINIDDEFNLSVVHENREGGTTWEIQFDSSVLSKVSETEDKNATIYVFKAIDAKQTTITLLSNRDKFSGQTCTVSIADGSVDNPFIIRTASELASIGVSESRPLDKHYKQINNIDLKDYTNWTPIAPEESKKFTGSYNGQNNTISNLNINNNETLQVATGLFGFIGNTGKVSNIVFDNVNIYSKSNLMGTVAGYSEGSVERITVANAGLTLVNSFDVVPTYNLSIGGIVGVSTRNGLNINLNRVGFNGNIEVSTSNVKVYTGGLVGTNEGSTIRNSYSRGSIESSNANNNVVIGGLVGLNTVTSETQTNIEDYTTNLKGNIINCYTTTEILAPNCETKGYIVGSNIEPDGTESTAYLDSESKNVNRIIGVYALNNNANLGWSGNATSVASGNFINVLSVQDLTQGPTNVAYKTYIASNGDTKVKQEASWNFEQVWKFDTTANDGYPTLRLDGQNVEELSIYDPYSDYISNEIYNASDLNNIRNKLDGTYIIKADIDLSGWNWVPIGEKDNPFTGTITNPDGKVITALSISNEYSTAGLFGYNAGVINGLIVKSANVQSGTCVGVMAGENSGEIINCKVESSTITSSSATQAGMIAGVNNNLIQGCEDSGTISVATSGTLYLGGVAGENAGTINNVISNAGLHVTATNASIEIGGIAGKNSAVITNCTRADNTNIIVSGTAEKVNAGGIAGKNLNGKISSSKAGATISIDTSINNGYAGGIVGYNEGNDALVKLTETVSGSVKAKWTGGLVGFSTTSDNNVVSITQSMVRNTVTLLGDEIGGLVGEIERGKITNCATYAKLDGKKMSGYASVIDGYTDVSGNGNYATVENCFAAVNYNASAGKRYCETTSEIRASNISILFNDNVGKKAGFVKSSIYDSSLASGAERKYSSYRIGSWQLVQPDDGANSTENCKKASTFTNRGFSTEYWSLIDGEYPTVKGL